MCLCDRPIFQHRSCIKSTIVVSKWKTMSFASLSADSSKTAQRCRQIHCWPLQSIFRIHPGMCTNSLLAIAVNLQKLPRDAHKFITNHHNQSSESAQRCTQIHYQSQRSIFRNSPEMHTNSLPITAINLQKQPRDAHKSLPRTLLVNSKVPHQVQLGLRFVMVHTASSAWDSASHNHQLFATVFNLTVSWQNVSASSLKMSFVKEDGTLHLLRWKRKMSQPFLPLYCSVLYDLHT